jgi:hypothetical protein
MQLAVDNCTGLEIVPAWNALALARCIECYTNNSQALLLAVVQCKGKQYVENEESELHGKKNSLVIYQNINYVSVFAKSKGGGNRKPETYNFFPLSFSHIGRVEIVTGISFGFFFYLC